MQEQLRNELQKQSRTARTLRLIDVRIALVGQVLFDRFDCTVEPGEIVVLMGASGSGKSTLLAFISGTLDRNFSASGRVLIGAREVTGLALEKRRVGLLFQDDLLFPHLSVGENLAFAIPARIHQRSERRRLVAQALADAELPGYEARDPATLSGGQRARISLLRTLLSQPDVLLLDEPFSKLDQALRKQLRAFVFDHIRDLSIPTLLVTHDENDIPDDASRVITLGEV